MHILIIGASGKRSIGYLLGEALRLEGHGVTYASRSGRLGLACDITDARSVRKIVKKAKPEAVIIAAGLFLVPHHMGKLKDYERIQSHILAKSLGPLMVADTLLAASQRSKLIMLAGRDVSLNRGFAPYTIGNGALWNLVRFINTHERLRAYYIDLPFVEGSTMERQFGRSARADTSKGRVGVRDIARVIRKILAGREKRERIVLGKGTT